MKKSKDKEVVDQKRSEVNSRKNFEADRSFFKKKEEKSKLVEPPRSFFTDFVSNKILDQPKAVEVEIGTKERRKKFEAPQPPVQPPAPTPAPPPPPPQQPVTNKAAAPANNNEEKKVIQKDRSVDVYNETVRQRVTRNLAKSNVEITKDVFKRIDSKVNKNATAVEKINHVEADVAATPKGSSSSSSSTTFVKKRRAPQPTFKCNDINDDELPSVRQLRDKFENDQRVASDTKLNVVPLSTKKREALNKLSFKKGFNVMSSLTRRGASALSISMHNLSSDSSDHHSQANDAGRRPGKRPNIISMQKQFESSQEPEPKLTEKRFESRSEEFITEPEMDDEADMSAPEAFIRAEVRPQDDDDVIETQASGFLWNPSDIVARFIIFIFILVKKLF